MRFRNRWQPSPAEFGRIGIAGVGLIGASIGLRATELGARVTGWDVAAEHLELARTRGAIAGQAGSFEALAAASDILVLATPLDVTLKLLAELSARPPATGLIVDVASVKAPVAEAGARLEAFVATHPIAGSERTGPQTARPDLFAERIWTYDRDAPRAVREAACRFIAALGARPLAVGNAEHDRVVALTSHLPQLVAVALGVQLEERAGERFILPLCGNGMRSMLRLGSSAWTMWRSVLLANAVPVAQEVRRLAAILIGIAEALDSGGGGLQSGFDAAARAVIRLDERNAAEPVVLANKCGD